MAYVAFHVMVNCYLLALFAVFLLIATVDSYIKPVKVLVYYGKYSMHFVPNVTVGFSLVLY